MSLRDLKNFPIRDEYSKMVMENVQWVDGRVTKVLSWIEAVMDELDQTLQDYKFQAFYVQQKALGKCEYLNIKHMPPKCMTVRLYSLSIVHCFPNDFKDSI